MIVTAALPWWNERPDDLEQCIRGIALIADRVVALDGSYRRYPEATVTSPPVQARTIRRVAAAVGLECVIIEPERLWAGQIEKRSALLAAASVDTDWFLTVDADHIIHTERDVARARLAAVPADIDVLEVQFRTPSNPNRPMAESAPGLWHVEQADTQVPLAHLWRSLPGYRVEERHWWLTALKNGERVWAWPGSHMGPGLAHAMFDAPYWIEHRTLWRTREQMLASRAFCNDREMVVRLSGQEDHVEGLPEPIFDFVRLPT